MRELAVGPWGWEKSAAKSRVHCLSRARRPFTADRLDDVGPPPAADGKGRGDYPAAQEAAVRPLVNAIIATAFRQYCDSVPIGALLNPRAAADERRVLTLEPLPAVSAPVEAAGALRHDPLTGLHQRSRKSSERVIELRAAQCHTSLPSVDGLLLRQSWRAWLNEVGRSWNRLSSPYRSSRSRYRPSRSQHRM